MKLLRITINPIQDYKDALTYQEFKKLENRKGLNAAKVGKLIAQKLGTQQKTEAALYGFFRRGERPISESRISILAEIFDVDQQELRKINLLRSHFVQLDFNPKLEVKSLLVDVPVSIKSLDEFLVWLWTENQRRDLSSKL